MDQFKFKTQQAILITLLKQAIMKTKMEVLRLWENKGYKEKLKDMFNGPLEMETAFVGGIYFKLPLATVIDKFTVFRDGRQKRTTVYKLGSYTKREALQQISLTVKRSPERGAMIKFMVEEGLVPCKSKCLYELVKKVEEKGLPIGSDGWNGVGQKDHAHKATSGNFGRVDDEDIFPHNRRNPDAAEKRRILLPWIITMVSTMEETGFTDGKHGKEASLLGKSSL